MVSVDERGVGSTVGKRSIDVACLLRRPHRVFRLVEGVCMIHYARHY